MATQNINIGINVSDNGTAKKTVKSFQEITQAATQAQSAAAGISAAPVKSTLAPGGTPGSRMVAATMAPSERMMSGEEYGRARGSAGATGASARDFANQAQGLGGLVRLYATYAANIFAVSAAFTALSNAMDTSNMVRGLDQLGAASGVALGSLSKDLVRATDGAISLRDAMTATAKASSSGMNSEQILRMGKVAQQASQALGVDMADAISRISRGITKLEPELLDELGLFTKTGKAAEDYAKSVGKSVTELTDFERRAAFANAVLEEGEKKFNQIKLDTNPYTKLLASIKDLAQVSLEFINKGLAPIVSYLSNSPTALGVAIAALGTVLVKQALPALGEFKAGLASTADKANQLSVQKAQDAAKARLAIDADILTRVEAMADDKVAAVDAAEQKIQALEASGLNKRSAAYKLLQKDITEVTQADIDAVETRAKLAEKGGDTKRAAAYREVTSAVLEQKQAEEDLIVTKKNLSKQLEKDAAGMTTYGMTVRAAEKAQTAATRANIVSNAAYNGSLIGVTASMALMRAEMQAAGIATNTFAGRLLLARGALAAVGGMVSTVMAAFGPLMLIITGLSLAFSLLDGALSKNNKESADLSGSLDKLDANASHLTKTVDALNEKPFLERMSPESLKVKATALGEVSSAISSTINDLLKADKAASGWDRFLDGFKTLWGGDMLSKASKGLATGITDSLANIAGSPEAKALNKDLSAILKIDTETATFQQVQDAIKKIGREAPQELKRLEDGFKKVSLASQVTAAKGTELVDAFKKLADLKQTIGNEFLPKDDVTKFGQELIATSQKLAIALDDPQQKLNAIIQLGANAVTIPGATLEQVAALNKAADLAKNIQTLEAKQLENRREIVANEKNLVDLIGETRAEMELSGKTPRLANLDDKEWQKLKDIRNNLKELKASGDVTVKVKTELTSKLEGYSKEIETATLGTYKAGADLVAKQISAEFIKAGKVVSDAYVNIIGETEATIKIKADSEKAVVNAQIQQILSQRDLTIATRELSLQLQKKSLEDYLQSNPEGRQGVYDQLDALRPQIQAVEAAKTGDFSKLKLSTDTKDLKKLNVEGDAFAQNMRASAAAVNNLQAQLKAIDIGEKDSALRDSFAEPKKNLENQEKSVSLAKQELDVQSKLVTQGNLEFLAAKQSLDTTQLNLQQRIALLSTDVEIARLSQIINSDASKTIKDAAKDKKEQLESDRKTLITQQAQQRITLASSQVQDEMRALAFNAEEARKREAENAELALAKKSEELRIEQDLFGLYNSIGLLTETQKINQKFLLEQKSAELDYEQKISKLKTSSSQQMGQLDSREEDIWAQFAAGTGNLAALNAELDKIAETKALITARTNEEGSAAARVRDNTLSIAAATKAAALDQERYNQMLESAGDFANTLKMGFEGAAESSQKIAAALGDVATTMAQVAINAEQRANSEAKLADDLAAARKSKDPLEIAAAESVLADQKEKNAKQELADDIKILNSSKKLFKEKTAAYKVLDATEKALHIKTLAREGVTLAKQISLWWTGVSTKVAAATAGQAGETAATSAGFLTRLPIYIKEIYASWGKLGPWMVGAAALFIASKLGGGGGGSSGAFVPTAEQRQETQGTAMGWDSSGNKVQVRQGVLGDTDAKSTAITNSLERLAENSVEGLDYDNKMLKALRSIANSIDGAAKGLYRIPGVVSGSISGTTPGTSGSGGFIGIGKKSTTTEILDSGVQFFGTMFDLFRSQNPDINLFESVRTTRSSSGLWGLGGGSSSSTDMFFQDLEQTNKRAYDQLIKALGGAGDLVYAMADFAGIAEDEVTTALKSLNVNELVSLRGLKGEEFTNELRALMGTLISDASYSIISQYEDFANFGEDLGEAVLRVQDSNKKVRQQLKNMMSADIEDTLNLQGVVPEIRTKIVSSISDTITWASGPQGHADWSTIARMGGKIAQGLYSAYADATNMAVESGTQFTNESFTTLLQENFSKLPTADLEKLRSAGFDWANEVVEVIEDGVTRKFDQASIKFESARITEDLIKLAGGEEAFFEQSTFFMENFMTEAERLVPTQKAVTTELARLADLGFTSADGLVDTREELAQLVQGLDKTDPAARKAYQALMDLAPGFDKVASRAESFSEPIRDLQLELLRATDKTEEYESATRALAISGFTAAEIASYDLRKSLEAEVKEADRATNSLDRLAQESLMLAANLLKAQGDMEGYNAAIAAIETKDMKTAKELAAYNDNQSLKRQIANEEAANRAREQAAQEDKRAAEKAAADAQQVADQKLSLEQRIYSIQGNTNKLRELELRKVDSSNQALQSYVWALEDYTNILKETEDTIKGLREKATDEYLSASDKVVEAQKAIADLAIEAAKKMRDFGSSLREFVNEQLMPESSANVTRLFTQTVQGALSGDEQALDSVRDIATQAIEAAKASARTSVEFNKARSTILASVSDVAAYAEAQAALTEIPEEDPLVLANKTLEEALKEQTDALYVANTIGASLVKSQEDLVALYFAAQSRVPSAPIAPFANGGIFDNDIIRRPTYFNLGLMGEAGAEAIMPLTRTRDGSLGVVATSEPNTNLGRAIGTQNAALVEQVKLLREEVSLLRYEARATAVSTTKTTRILERVTQNGESLLVTDTATL